MASTWLSEARAVRSQARKNESPQVFVQPIYKGKALVLEYRNFKLRIRDLKKKTIKVLRHSGVPRFLINEKYATWGSHVPPVLYIHGKIIRSRINKKKKYFVALEVRGENDVQYHNQIASLHLLFARHFFTPMSQCSWMHTKEINPKSLKKRLAAKADLKIGNFHGRCFTPKPPIGLKLYDCMAQPVAKAKKTGKK